MTHDPFAGEPPESVSPAIRPAIRFIEDHWAEPLSVAQLAGLCDLSLNRFAAVFRREVGLPPHQYVCRTRVRRAQALLRDGVPPAIAAVEAGFFDQSHLYRHFKRHCGTTPGAFAARDRIRSPTCLAEDA